MIWANGMAETVCGEQGEEIRARSWEETIEGFQGLDGGWPGRDGCATALDQLQWTVRRRICYSGQLTFDGDTSSSINI